MGRSDRSSLLILLFLGLGPSVMKAIEECLPPEREEDIEKIKQGGSQTETHVVGSLFVSIPTRVGSMRMV